MRAVYYNEFGGPEVLNWGTAPDPVPGPDDVLIEVHAASVVPGDCKLRAGHLTDLFDITFPKIPGRDGAGVVRDVGSRVRRFAPGQRVCFVCQHAGVGSNAELTVCPEDEVVAMPDGLTFEEAAALLHAGVCAWIVAADTARLEPGEQVLVHGGAGAIGGMIVQIAKHLGAVVTTTCSARNRDYVTGLGADEVIAYDEEDFTDRGRVFDAVIDLIGGEVNRRSFPLIRKGGRLVYLLAEPFEDLSSDYGVELLQARIRDTRAVLEKVATLAGEGVLRPQVARVLLLSAAAEAHRCVEAGDISRGRLVLKVRDEGSGLGEHGRAAR